MPAYITSRFWMGATTLKRKGNLSKEWVMMEERDDE